MNFKFILKIIVGLFAIYALTRYDVLDFSSIEKLDLALSLKLLALISLIIFFGSVKWYYLLKVQDKTITFKETFESYYLGYALNHILFGIAGDVIKTIYLVKNKDNKLGLSLSVVIDRIIGLVSMLIIILACIPKIFSIGKFSESYFAYFGNIELYYIILFIFLLSAFIFFDKVIKSRRINKVILLFLYKYKNRFIKFAAKTLKLIFTYRKSTRNLLINLIIAIIVQFIIGFAIYIICKNIISYDLSFFINLISSLAVQIINVIPKSPGNIGVGEAAFSQVMYLLNDNIILKYASIYFIFRIFNMLYSIPGFIIYYVVINRSNIRK